MIRYKKMPLGQKMTSKTKEPFYGYVWKSSEACNTCALREPCLKDMLTGLKCASKGAWQSTDSSDFQGLINHLITQDKIESMHE
jgi:hypothetical protein